MIIVKGMSKEDLEAWMASPVAQEVFKAVRAAQQQIGHDGGRGIYVDKIDYNPYKTQAKSFEATGRWQAFDDVLNMEVEGT